MKDTTRVGMLSEYYVAYTLVDEGFSVSLPTGNPRYDIIAEKDSQRYFIQVKGCEQKNEAISVVLTGGLSPNRKIGYTEGEVDVIAVHNRTDNKVYYVPIDETFGRSGVYLRLSDEGRVLKNTRFAKDYVKFPYNKAKIDVN